MNNSATSIHEAGHCVTALYCRLKVERVTIVREGDAAGMCLVRLSDNPAVSAAVLLAGYLAAKLAFPYETMTTSDSDFQAAAALLPAGADLNDLVGRVNRRLLLLWENVERVAKVLDYHGEILGVELIRAVAGLPYLLPKGE
jgi:Peptidase M50B-like